MCRDTNSRFFSTLLLAVVGFGGFLLLVFFTFFFGGLFCLFLINENFPNNFCSNSSTTLVGMKRQKGRWGNC